MNIKPLFRWMLFRPAFLKPDARSSFPTVAAAELPVEAELRGAAPVSNANGSAPISLVTWAQSFVMLMELEQMLDRNDPAARRWLELALPTLRQTLGDTVVSFAAPIQRNDFITALHPLKEAIALCLRLCGNPG